MRYFLAIIILIISGYLLYSVIVRKKIAQETVILHFGLRGVDDFKRAKGQMDQHPSGIGFLDLSWPDHAQGKVKIITYDSDIVLENLHSAMGVRYKWMAEDGIQGIDLNGTLHSSDYVSKREAYNGYAMFIQQINDKGWKRYVAPYEARIAMEDNLKHLKNHYRLVNSSYIPSFAEWNDYPNAFGIYLYNGEVEVSILIRLESFGKDKLGEERYQYYIKYSFTTHKLNLTNAIGGASEMNAEEFANALQRFKVSCEKMRTLREDDARQKGFRIDESYVDPDIWQYVK